MKQFYFYLIFLLFFPSFYLLDSDRSKQDKKDTNVVEVTIKQIPNNKNKLKNSHRISNLNSELNSLNSNKETPIDVRSQNKMLKNNIKVFETDHSKINLQKNQNLNIKNQNINQTTNKNIHINRVQSPSGSIIKQESVEYILPSLAIDTSHRIDYYYPYFYKTHVVDYYESIDYKDLTNVCSDLGCDWCKITNSGVCMQCRHGYYAFNQQCYTICPKDHVADIFRRTCNPVNINSNSFLT
jgi:hypothetical protein